MTFSSLIAAVFESHRRLPDAAKIREALRRADISLEKCCLYMVDDRTGKPKDRNLLERQLHGEGHLRHTDLCKLPVSFWRWYLVLMIEELGVPREIKRAIPIVLAVAAHKRMARASLQTSRQLEQRKERVS